MFEGSAALRLVEPESQRGFRRKPGHPRYIPTQEQRHQVELLSAYGFTHRAIRQFILNPTTGKPISLRTLQQTFSTELRTSKARAEAAVASNVFRIATMGRGRAAIRAAIFWLKSRAGWCDKCGHPCQSADAPSGLCGVATTPRGMNPEEWIELQRQSCDQ